jgi:hypothetical protein
VDAVPDPLLLRKSGSAGNRTRDLWIYSQELWTLDDRGVEGNCEKYNEPSDSMKYWEILEWLSYGRLLEDSAPWSSLVRPTSSWEFNSLWASLHVFMFEPNQFWVPPYLTHLFFLINRINVIWNAETVKFPFMYFNLLFLFKKNTSRLMKSPCCLCVCVPASASPYRC